MKAWAEEKTFLKAYSNELSQFYKCFLVQILFFPDNDAQGKKKG